MGSSRLRSRSRSGRGVAPLSRAASAAWPAPHGLCVDLGRVLDRRSRPPVRRRERSGRREGRGARRRRRRRGKHRRCRTERARQSPARARTQRTPAAVVHRQQGRARLRSSSSASSRRRCEHRGACSCDAGRRRSRLERARRGAGRARRFPACAEQPSTVPNTPTRAETSNDHTSGSGGDVRDPIGMRLARMGMRRRLGLERRELRRQLRARRFPRFPLCRRCLRRRPATTAAISPSETLSRKPKIPPSGLPGRRPSPIVKAGVLGRSAPSIFQRGTKIWPQFRP